MDGRYNVLTMSPLSVMNNTNSILPMPLEGNGTTFAVFVILLNVISNKLHETFPSLHSRIADILPLVSLN